MIKTGKDKGLTLLEIIITASLVTVVGLAVFSTFSSGLKIWYKLTKNYAEEDVSIFFEKISTDLRNSFQYEGIDFIGQDEVLSFASLITTPSDLPGLRRGPGQIIYSYDSQGKTVIKEKRNLNKIYREEKGLNQELLKEVEFLKFDYYLYDPLRKEYFWVEEWEEEKQSLPLAVRVRLDIIHEGKKYRFTKTIDVPLGKEEI